MWVILGASIGLAALIDRHKAGTIDARLGSLQTLENGIKLKLPATWVEEEEPLGDLLASVSDPEYARAVEVRIKRPALSDVLNLVSPPRVSTPLGRIQIDGDDADLRYRQYQTDEGYLSEFTARRPLSRGRTLEITLSVGGYYKLSELKRERVLLERIAGSIELPEEMRSVLAPPP